MNEIKENQVIEENETENDMPRRRAAYRRGARDKIKGNFAMVIVVCVLVAVVALGIFFAVKTFMPDSGKGIGEVNVSVGDQSTDVQADEAGSSAVFDSVIEQYTILMNDTALKENEGGNISFEEGILNYCREDIDADGAQELLLVTVNSGNAIELSVYENNDGVCARNGYYIYTDDVFDIADNAKCEIYISENDGKFYICTEKYNFGSGRWELDVIGYDDGFKAVDEYIVSDGNGYDDIENEIKEFGLKYSGADYGEGTQLKMNGDTDGATLLCSFETKDSTLSLDIG